MSAVTLLSPRRLVGRWRPGAGFPGGAVKKLARPMLVRPGAKRLPSLGRLGELEVRLAATASEVRRAQALRYRVFYEEMAATPDFRARHTRRDIDRFDRFCDHLLVIDHSGGRETIVGTYRLLRHDVADLSGGFYSAGEFDIAPLLARRPELRFLELGRSCVLPPHRNKRVLELLWHGIWSYVRAHHADVMIGCASLAGTDPRALSLPLAFLHHHARAAAEWHVAAHAGQRVDMNLLPAAEIDAKAALRVLPPLVKGYLRLGASVGDGAVVDHQFGTTDVLMVLPVAAIADRYIAHYGSEATRYAPSLDRAPLAAA